MILNSNELFFAAPIKDMVPVKVVAFGMTYGLGEAGYDIRIKQEVVFKPSTQSQLMVDCQVDGLVKPNTRFTLASAIEEFQMPSNLVGRVCDKSSWARKGLSVFNTVIEPGWVGFLTLELVYHGSDQLIIPAGAPIAQILFEEIKIPAQYKGKYQFQSSEPTPARHQNVDDEHSN